MHRRLLQPVTGAIVLMLISTASACLWDYDTLRDERRGLLGIAEVLAGKWEKHSKFFYEQRVEKMKALIAREPGNLAAYDNLAVAYEKLNDQDAAIEVMRAKERVKPGEYTTEANLGTFYLHKGDLPQGIAHIRTALQINPDAHFGREEYQLKLAEFLLAGRENPRRLTETNFLGLAPERQGERFGRKAPTSSPATQPDESSADLADAGGYWWAMRGYPDRLAETDIKPNAMEGIVGIIRFGTGTSAELYLTLGDLLSLRGDKNLAYRAYQRALDFKHPRAEYIRGVMAALRETIHDGKDIKPEKITAERAAADVWVKAYQQYEDDLVRTGKNTEDESNYAAFYSRYGPRDEDVSPTLAERLLPREPSARAAEIYVAGLIALICILIAFFIWRRRRKRRQASKSATAIDA